MQQENKNKKMRNSIIIMSFLLSLILLTTSVSALKIAPAVKNFNLATMNAHEQYSINILESKGEVEYELKADNKELLRFVKLEKKDNKIIVNVDKPNIKLPEDNNLVEILVKESGDKEGMFSSNIILKSKLNFLKPIKGAFLKSNYVVQNNDFDDPIIFTISLENKGTTRVTAYGNVILKNSEGAVKKVQENILLEENTLDIGERGKVAKTWNHNLRRGSYESKATLVYSGKTKEFEKSFNIGKPTILFKEVFLNDYSKEGISRIDVEGELDWNFDREVYLEINNNPSATQLTQGYEKADYKLYIDNLNSISKVTIVAKDKEGNNMGTYEINSFELIKRYERERFWKWMIALIIVLILIIIIAIKTWQKKVEKKKDKTSL